MSYVLAVMAGGAFGALFMCLFQVNKDRELSDKKAILEMEKQQKEGGSNEG